MWACNLPQVGFSILRSSGCSWLGTASGRLRGETTDGPRVQLVRPDRVPNPGKLRGGAPHGVCTERTRRLFRGGSRASYSEHKMHTVAFLGKNILKASQEHLLPFKEQLLAGN